MTSIYTDLRSSYDGGALLFTNSDALTVFVDHAFLELMHYSQAAIVIGKPFRKALGIEEGQAKALLTRLRDTSHFEDQVLDALDANGDPLRLLCSGITKIDDIGKFIGADFRLRQALSEADIAKADNLPLPALNLENDPSVDNTFLQFYFSSRVKALYILLARLMGTNIHDRLDKVINESAQRHGWMAQIKGGIFTADVVTTPLDAYRQLMQDAQRYSENVLGVPMVKRELQDVDKQFHPGVIALAVRHGLRASDEKQ